MIQMYTAAQFSHLGSVMGGKEARELLNDDNFFARTSPKISSLASWLHRWATQAPAGCQRQQDFGECGRFEDDHRPRVSMRPAGSGEAVSPLVWLEPQRSAILPKLWFSRAGTLQVCT